MKKVIILLAGLFLTSSIIFSNPKTYDNPGVKPEPKEKNRPSVALVLSGGGINGAAEIPVLEEIERLGIPIDMIFGTSVGSIVGGLYAGGYTIDMIYNLFFTQNWPEIFADFSPSPYEKLYKDHGSQTNLFPLPIGMDGMPQLGKGLTNGQKAYQMLKELTLKYSSDIDFDDLPIPFRCVATDMISGEPYLFSSGDLAEAIRASMNVGGLFEPLNIDGHYLLDGGLTHNMPVHLAKQMGYDIIIAVEIGPSSNKDVRTYDILPIFTLENSIFTPMKTIDEIEAKEADLVLYPDMSSFAITDFEEAAAIYEEGKKAVLAARSQFEKIRDRIYPDGNTPKEKEDLYSRKNYLVPDRLIIKNGCKEDIKYIRALFQQYKDQECNRIAYRDFLNKVYATGHYKQVQTRYMYTEDQLVLELLLTQKPAPTFRLLVGGDLEQTSTSDTLNSFANLNMALQFRGFSSADSLLSIRLTFLNDWIADFFYFQPISRNVFTTFQTKYTHEIFGTYKRYSYWQSNIGIGANYFNNAYFTNGIFFNMAKIPENFMTEEKSIKWDTGYMADFNFSLLDQPCFSHKGFEMNIGAKYIIPAADILDFKNAALFARIDTKGAVPIGKKFSIGIKAAASWDFTGNLSENYNLTAMEANSNYNRIYFPQNGEKDMFSPTMFAGALSVQFSPVDHLTIAGGRIYIIAAATWGTLDKLENGQWSVSGGAGLRIWDSCNLLFRMGAASTADFRCTPFVTLDIGALNF